MKTFLLLVTVAVVAVARRIPKPTDCITVNCVADPCSYITCPAFPGATCVSNYCGGCNAEFYVRRRDVTSLCNTPTCIGKEIDVPVCKEEVNCLVRPCSINTCPTYPDAECQNNFCGDCNAIFTYEDKDVTECCNN